MFFLSVCPMQHSKLCTSISRLALYRLLFSFKNTRGNKKSKRLLCAAAQHAWWKVSTLKKRIGYTKMWVFQYLSKRTIRHTNPTCILDPHLTTNDKEFPPMYHVFWKVAFPGLEIVGVGRAVYANKSSIFQWICAFLHLKTILYHANLYSI